MNITSHLLCPECLNFVCIGKNQSLLHLPGRLYLTNEPIQDKNITA